MCQVQFKTDELKPCRCGFKPDHYTVGYGQTPYDVFCPNCKKQTSFAKCKITGWNGNLFDYWNKHIAQMTLEEVEHEPKYSIIHFYSAVELLLKARLMVEDWRSIVSDTNNICWDKF